MKNLNYSNEIEKLVQKIDDKHCEGGKSSNLLGTIHVCIDEFLKSHEVGLFVLKKSKYKNEYLKNNGSLVGSFDEKVRRIAHYALVCEIQDHIVF